MRSYDGLKSQDLEILLAIFAFSGKTTPYGKTFKVLFRKFTWRHRLTLLCSNVVKFVRRQIGEILRYLLHTHTKKISAASETVATAQIAPKICQGQPPTFGSHCSRFHPNRFTFGGNASTPFFCPVIKYFRDSTEAKHCFGRLIIVIINCAVCRFQCLFIYSPVLSQHSAVMEFVSRWLWAHVWMCEYNYTCLADVVFLWSEDRCPHFYHLSIVIVCAMVVAEVDFCNHCVSKNDTGLDCYKFDAHSTILIIFGRNVAKKVSNQTVLYFFPAHLTSASALLGETESWKLRLFT